MTVVRSETVEETAGEAAAEGARAWTMSALTVEGVAYASLILLALGLRLVALGRQPLAEGEVSLAVDAWHFYRGQVQAIRGHSPLLFFGAVLSYFVFSPGDAVARLIPALAGAGLVGLPYFLRQRLGRLGALATSVVLALSPSLLFFSRSLTGEVIVAAGTLSVLGSVLLYLEKREPSYLYWTAGALALSLTAGPGVYAVLFHFTTFPLMLALVSRWNASEGRAAEAVALWHEVAAQRNVLVRAGGIFVLSFVGMSTGLLANVAGMQAALDLLTRWAGQLAARGRPDRLFHLRLLVAYELFPLIFGLLGVVFLLRRRSVWAAFLVYWFAGSFVLGSLAGRSQPAGIVLTALPLVLLAGTFLDRLLNDIVRNARLTEEGLFLLLAAVVVSYLYLQLGGYAATGQSTYLTLGGAGVIVLLGSIAFFWSWLGRTMTLRAMGVALLVFLSLWMLHLSWQANYEPRAQPNELLAVSRTSDDVRRLRDTLETISNNREGARHLLQIAVHDELTPALAWYLREFESVRFVENVGAGTEAPAIVVPAEPLVALQESYIGQKYRLSTAWDPMGLTLRQWVHWLLYREAPTEPTVREIILYVRR